MACAGHSHAAPLDALLHADHNANPFRPAVEVGADFANRSVDFLNLRPKRADGTYGPSGNYSGGYLLAGMRVSKDIWLDAGLWGRSIDYVSTAADITSWQLAGQWKAFEDEAQGRTLAVRLGAWGNKAPVLRKNTSVTVQGTTFSSAQATEPRDAQIQIDAIGTIRASRTTTFSAAIGGGRSKVTFKDASATTQAGTGCVYDVTFTDTNVVQTCSQNGADIRISTPNSVLGIDVNREGRYTARFASIAFNGTWESGPWKLRGGVQHTTWDRDSVDDIVQSRGADVYKSNTVAVAEVGYRAMAKSTVFLRAQVMAHQFVGETPFTYNTLTASQHKRKYGFVTVGLAHAF